MTPPPPRGGPFGRDPDIVARRRKRRRTRARNRRRRRGLVAVILLSLPVALIVVGGIGGAVAYESPSCDLAKLKPVTIGENSFVYARNGTVLGAIPAERNRTPVTAAQMSPWLRKATVAIEDRRFYEHGGVDYQGIFRAALADLQAGKVVQGGSTITQQLVRNLYTGQEKTFRRKLVEACLATKLARRWSKARILTAYMNQVYYGNHAYGVEAAAETYFSKSAKKLSLEQAAMIAGLPQLPSVYDPFHRPQDALARRNAVLKAMLTSGDITSSEYARAVADRSLHLKAGRRYTRIREPYFFSYVEDELTQEYGAATVRSGGLKVYTTIDPRLQREAVQAIKHNLPYATDPSAAVVSIDPRNGDIRAMTAVTPGNKNNKFNLVSQAHRQPGSTFKAIALATAISLGVNPETTSYLSAPLVYSPDPSGSCNTTPPTAWCVSTYDHTYAGVISLATATIRSDNTVYARLSLDIGPDKIAKMAYDLGVRNTHLCGDCPSIALGSNAVTPLEMASVYATLAAGGVYSKPIAIRRVVLPTGKEDTESGWGKPDRERVIPDWVAYETTKVLEQNMLYGTGTNAYTGRISAGKTGTTDNFADAWFCGYVPQLETSVWVGYPRGEIPMLNVHGIAVAGATFPSYIWHEYMTAALAPLPELDFPKPAAQPNWISWHGQYQYSGATSTTTTTTGSTTTSTTATTTAGTTTTTDGATTTAPATTAGPPPTTEPAPTTPPAPAPTTAPVVPATTVQATTTTTVAP